MLYRLGGYGAPRGEAGGFGQISGRHRLVDAFDRRDNALAVLGQRLEPVEPYVVEEPETSWSVRETRAT
jgi:hypothetical protein